MGFLTPTAPPVRGRGVAAALAPGADQAAGPGLGGERVRHPDRRLPPLRRQADPLRRRRALVISATTPASAARHLGDWWTEPIVFQKAVVWTMLWEVLGLGAGSLPLTLRFSPMIGGVLYWLRPGTTRLPPWPERVPLTRGTARTLFDVAPLRGAARVAAVPAVAGRPEAVTRHAESGPAGISLPGDRYPGPPRPGRRRRPARLPRRARPARQGPVPGRPGGDLRQPDDRLPLPARQHDRRRPARLLLHLVGGGVLEAEPPLPLRRHGDDQQHALEPLAGGEAAPLPRPPRGPAALIGPARSPPTSAR